LPQPESVVLPLDVSRVGAVAADGRTRERRLRAAQPFELLDAKLAVPAVRPGTVMRPGLVNRLRAASSHRVVSIVAPAGYGKTTLLAQWAARDERAFAWVAIDDGDDAVALLRYVAAALETVEPIDARVHAALAAPGPSVWSRGLPRLASALKHMPAPVVVVLDGVHFARSGEAARAIATLVGHVPEGSTVVLAGRMLPELPVARLRADGVLLEVGADELALSRREAAQLLSAAQLELGEEELAELDERTEGWAAGLHLAALFLGNGSRRRRSSAEFSGADRFVADYFRFEYLSQLGAAEVRFLTRSSVLDTMCGPLCDTVVGSPEDSSARLEWLEGASLFVVPLDRRRARFRYHHLFRDALRAELERREPQLVPELNRRASAWCEANGEPEAARRYAAAAGDVDSLARLVTAHAFPAYTEGHAVDLESWLDGLGDLALLERYPAVAVVGSWTHALGGRPGDATRWLEAAEHASAEAGLPDDMRSTQPLIALLRAAFCRDGAEQMLADATTAAHGLEWNNRWRPTAVLLRGVAHRLLGQDDRAETLLAEAADIAATVGAVNARRLALAERSLLAGAAGDHVRARDLADEARSLLGGRERGVWATSAIEVAASARAELRVGRWQQARTEIAEAESLTPTLTHALPWCSVQASLELARAQMALLDTTAAAAFLDRAESILERRPALGVLSLHAKAVRVELRALREDNGRRQATLTAAELRLLPLLTTRLSFREIGEQLYVSRNTVKTQAIAVYRKLGVSSRNEAIDRAAELGLLDGSSS
jgi:LuxR family transcriptional regulator, maltose regulon positive regulatory protein